MKLYTSNYARNHDHPNAVGISIVPPKWYKGKGYPRLAPTWDMVKDYKNGVIDEAEYTRKYLKILENLNPTTVATILGDGAVMLCYESPTDFCHRHIVAVWMTEAGIEVEELLDDPPRNVEDFIEL